MVLLFMTNSQLHLKPGRPTVENFTMRCLGLKSFWLYRTCDSLSEVKIMLMNDEKFKRERKKQMYIKITCVAEMGSSPNPSNLPVGASKPEDKIL